jgi:hypothetical protein
VTATEPVPAADADWWERLYADKDADLDTHTGTAADVDEPDDTADSESDTADTDADTGDTAAVPGWLRPDGAYYEPVRTAVQQRTPRPALSAGTQRFLYNAAAAGAGYLLGLVPWLDSALCSCGREASIGAALLLGGTGTALVAHVWDRRTRHWWPGLAWAARIPLASCITALALYAPAQF